MISEHYRKPVSLQLRRYTEIGAPLLPSCAARRQAVLSYIVPRLDRAERVIADAQRAATPRQGYVGFDLALKVLHECKQAVSTEPTRNAAVTLQLLDTAIDTLKTVSGGDAAAAAHEASALMKEATTILRPPE